MVRCLYQEILSSVKAHCISAGKTRYVALGVAVGPKSRFLGGRSFGEARSPEEAGRPGRSSRDSRVAGAVTAALLAVLVAFPAALPARAATLATASSGEPAGSGAGQPGVATLDVTVLVDESGSETRQSVADEQQTVGTIVQTMLNPASRVTVIGFGGVNNVVRGQSPVDLLCQPTIASGAANLDYLAKRNVRRAGDIYVLRPPCAVDVI